MKSHKYWSRLRNRKIRGNEILTIVFMVEITAEAFRQKDILYEIGRAHV